MIYIYILKHPVTKDIRYVGKTTNPKKRLANHISSTNRNEEKSYKNNWIKSLLIENLKPEIEVIDQIDSINWEWLEEYWISQFKSWGFNLTNMTNGGENPPNWKGKTHSTKHRQKLSKLMSENNPAKNMNNEWREAIRQSHKKNGFTLPESAYTKIRRPVQQFTLEGEFIREYKSLTEAANMVGLKHSTPISLVCRGKRGKSASFKWKFKE